MRTEAPPLLPLFRSQMQVELLALLLAQPDRAWTREELARTVRTPASSAHRELIRAIEAGIVVRDERARPHRYHANRESPVFEPLRALLDQTVNVPDRLRAALSDYAVTAAAIHGSWASGSPGRDSDIDVIVVAREERDAIRRSLRQAGRALGREIDVSVVDPDELRQLLADGNPFARLILDRPRIDLIGDLAEVAR
jgi:predicted nucleotidyltransferase